MTYFRPQPKNKPIRLKGADYTQLKEEVYARDGGRCQTCKRKVPLRINGIFDPFSCANLSHIKHRSLGGSDTLENTIIQCFECHQKYPGKTHDELRELYADTRGEIVRLDEKQNNRN